MLKILVPVDFYKTSFSAFKYAVNFSKLFPNAEVTLLHVINGSFNTNDIVRFDPMEAMQDAALKRMEYFHKEYPKELGIELPQIIVKKDIRFGIPGFTITEYATANNYDLIIMGTRDQHNIFDKLLGSVSAITLRTASCPVLLIHEDVRFNTPKKIVFAFDEKSDLENSLERYYKLNSVIKAKTDFVHVNKKGKDNIRHQKLEIIEEMFEDHNSTFFFEIKAIEGNKVHSALKNYCLLEKSDMLAMMHRKEGVFSGIFRTHQSVKMAQDFHLPVLVFHEDN